MFINNFIDYLLSVTAITDICSTRIKYKKIAQNSDNPYIIISRVSGFYDQELDGDSDFTKLTLSIKCYADSYLVAEQLFEAVRLNLDGYQQALIGTFWINSVKLVDDFDGEEDPVDADQEYLEIREGIYDISFPIANPVT